MFFFIVNNLLGGDDVEEDADEEPLDEEPLGGKPSLTYVAFYEYLFSFGICSDEAEGNVPLEEANGMLILNY